MPSKFLPGDLVLAGMLVALCSAVGPPQVGQYQSRQIAEVGQTKKKFECPVTADPLPFVQWYKNGEIISEIWTRHRIKKEGSLRIRDIEFEDAGKYVCKATNGFGTINVNYSLIVVDTKTGLVKQGDDIYKQNPDEDLTEEGVSPHFIEEQKMQRKSSIVRPVDSSVRLKCRATGNPRPQVRWVKDGLDKVALMDDPGDDEQKWTLKLHDLKEDDSGHYQCLVSNKHGVINFTYSVEVIGKIQAKPMLIGPNPKNESVIVGGTASFLCKVKSMVQPHIQWLKRVDKQSDLEPNNSATIEVKGQKFMVLKTGEVLRDSEGFFVNKLLIKNVLPIDVGMYICLGANTMGYSFRSAFLTLADGSVSPHQFSDDYVPGSSSSGMDSESSSDSETISNGNLPLMIAIPAAVAIVLVVLAIYILQRRRRCNTQSTTQRNTRFNAVPTQENAPFPAQTHSNVHMLQPSAPQPPLIYNNTSRSNSDKLSKNHSIDFYSSDISSVSRSHHKPHYNGMG